MSVDLSSALQMVKARLNRLQSDTTLDEYLQSRIDAAVSEIEGTGIHLTDSADDLMLVVDYAVEQYQGRDKPGGLPDWLRLRRRERWLHERTIRGVSADDS